MDTRFTEEQQMLKTTARDFLARECPPIKVRELEKKEKGYSPEVWKGMADMGWMGLVIPEEYGGLGMSFQDLTIVLEEMGRSVFLGPYFCTVVEGSIPILDAGSEEQKKELLPRIARGEAIWTLALLEASGRYDASGIAVKATPKGNNFIINGTKLFVEQASNADYMVVVTRTGKGASPEEGITLFIVEAKTPGVHCEVIPTMGRDRQCEVTFTDVSVPKKNMLGKLNQGWAIVEKVLEKGAIAKCAESIGGMAASTEMTVAYCKDRVQYGKPIGWFQALQHIMSDMWIATDVATYLVYEAAWMESEGIPCAREAAMAKSYVNEAYKRVTERAVELHGGIGTSDDADIAVYYRRAKVNDIAFGGTDLQREKVARLIGLVS